MMTANVLRRTPSMVRGDNIKKILLMEVSYVMRMWSGVRWLRMKVVKLRIFLETKHFLY